jgi:hypothetical protein
MNIQYDLFDMTEEDRRKRAIQEKLSELAIGKHTRSLKGKAITEAHEKKCEELFGDSCVK